VHVLCSFCVLFCVVVYKETLITCVPLWIAAYLFIPKRGGEGYKALSRLPESSRIFQEFPDFRFFPGFSENCKLLWPGCKVREGFCKVSKAVKVKEGFVKVGKG
jgi:hypothetical protein